MARDYTSHIRQLTQARENALKGIENAEAASKLDGADRSGTIASIRATLVSYDKQLADIEKLTKPAEAKAPELTPEKVQPAPEPTK